MKHRCTPVAHLPALAHMIGRPGWRGVAVQMTPYLLHSRTLPHLYGTATSRCPNGQLGELRRTCTWEEPSTFIRSKLQCRHNFIEHSREVPAYCWPARYAHVSLCAVRLGGMSAAASAPRSCSGCANGVVAPKLAAQGWLPPRQTCHRRSAVTRDPSEVDCSRADSADARVHEPELARVRTSRRVNPRRWRGRTPGPVPVWRNERLKTLWSRCVVFF